MRPHDADCTLLRSWDYLAGWFSATDLGNSASISLYVKLAILNIFPLVFKI